MSVLLEQGARGPYLAGLSRYLGLRRPDFGIVAIAVTTATSNVLARAENGYGELVCCPHGERDVARRLNVDAYVLLSWQWRDGDVLVARAASRIRGMIAVSHSRYLPLPVRNPKSVVSCGAGVRFVSGYTNLPEYAKTCEGLHRDQYVFMVGKAKAVYVREQDVELWERAERYADSQRLTMSALVLTALERYLAEVTENDQGRKPRK